MLTILYGQTRIMFAMSRDGLLPRGLRASTRARHAGRSSPSSSALLIAVLAAFVPLTEIAELVNIGTLFAFVLVNIGVIILRRTRPGPGAPVPRPVRAGVPDHRHPAVHPRQSSHELSTTTRLQDRREVAAGTRAYSIGFEDGRFYANGWHITGEMGGVWTPPLKLLDGVWFGLDGQWVGPATKFTSGWGYTRYDLPDTGGPAACSAPTSCPTAAAARCSASRSPTPARRADREAVRSTRTPS